MKKTQLKNKRNSSRKNLSSKKKELNFLKKTSIEKQKEILQKKIKFQKKELNFSRRNEQLLQLGVGPRNAVALANFLAIIRPEKN